LEERSLFSNASSDSPETPTSTEQPPVPAPASRSRRGLLVAVAAVAAVVIVAVALMIPQGVAVIPLNVEYTVGEKLTYNVTLTSSMQVPDADASSLFAPSSGNITVNGKLTTEVVSFDGEFYALNQTITMTLDGKPYTFSYLERMNKTGYSSDFFNMAQQLSTNESLGSAYVTQLLSNPEVKVGESIRIPISKMVGDTFGANFTGDVVMTFGGVQDLTVPAGKYKVFRVDTSTENVAYHAETSILGSSLSMDMALNMTGQTYTEYGTMLPVQYTMAVTLVLQSSVMNYTLSMNMDLTLAEQTTP
jgi:hypothetical protein